MSSDEQFSPGGNRLLAALPPDELERLLPHLTPRTMSAHEVVYDSDEPIREAYFPLSGTVSIVALLEDGSMVEAGMVGKEAFAGVPVVLGREVVHNRRAMIQVPGSGLALKARVLKEEFDRHGALHRLVLQYLHAFITQIAQTAICNRLHHVEQRLARWLLAAQMRTESDELRLTHEVLSTMLGTRRAGVTEAAGNLQKAGLIRYSRGVINILDLAGLEKTVCECHQLVEQELRRLYDR